MDIEFLLWLQNFREASGNIFTPFMQLMSDITVFMLLPVFVYWCISKRAGLFLMLTLFMNCLAFNVLKAVFAVPRPFLRDSRILPLQRSSSYSFPSGHTAIASSVSGGFAVIIRRKWVSWICGAVIVLVALSRMYNGVHTLQDVAAGTVLGFFCLWVSSALLERENVMNVILLVLCAVCLAYVSLNPSHDNSPVFLVLARRTFFYGGTLLGFMIGHYIERKYINFRETGLKFKGITLAVIGLVPYYLVYFVYMNKVIAVFESFITVRAVYFVAGLAVTFYAAALWPLVIKKFCE